MARVYKELDVKKNDTTAMTTVTTAKNEVWKFVLGDYMKIFNMDRI